VVVTAQILRSMIPHKTVTTANKLELAVSQPARWSVPVGMVKVNAQLFEMGITQKKTCILASQASVCYSL